MTNLSPVVVQRVGTIGVIELAQPDKLNALSIATLHGIEKALDEFESAGSGVRVLLIKAQGKHFCAGADLVEAKALREDAQRMAGFTQLGHRILLRLESSALPVVAACQGLALAGGGELMLACDVVIASADFRFGDQHAQYGLIPGWGGSQRLPRLVGLRRSMDLFYSATWIDAPTALQWGLVNQVVERDKLSTAALAYCDQLALRSRNGIAAMKRLARGSEDLSLQEGLRMEADACLEIMASADVTEGLAAFEDRRPPVFGG